VLALYRNPNLNNLHLAAQTSGRTPFVEDLTTGSLNFLTLLVVVVVVVSVAMMGRLAWDRWRKQLPHNVFSFWLFLIGFAFAGLVQYTPVPDSRHIWWGVPLGILVVFGALGRKGLWSPLKNPLSLVIATAAVAAAIAGSAYLGVQRVKSPDWLVTKGMSLGAADMTDLDAAAQLLSRCVGDRSAVFLVANGVWSVFDSKYHSVDAQFVDWGGPLGLEARLKSVDIVVTDNLKDQDFHTVLYDFGFHEFGRGPILTCYRKN